MKLRGSLSKIKNILFQKRLFSEMSIDQLSMLPEFKNAILYEKKGDFSNASPMYLRSFDVIQSIAGEKSPLSSYISLKMAQNECQAGNFKKAIEIANKNIHSSIEYEIKKDQFLSKVYLMFGDSDSSLKHSEQATNAAEKHHELLNDRNILSNSYTCMGISSLFSGQMDDSETFFQLAIRWANTPLSRVITLSNMGFLCWQSYLIEKQISSPQSYLTNQIERIKISRNSEDATMIDKELEDVFLKEALSYWEEAIEESNKSASDLSQEKSQICGPMDASSVPVMGQESSSKGKAPSHSSNPQNLETNLENVFFAASYSTVLNNLAEAYSRTSQHAKASEFLSSALKAFDSSKDPEANSFPSFSDPYVGRSLGLVAMEHFSASQAVSSEGLFRSALQKLDLPYAKHDVRHIFTKAQVLGAYASLLSQWEKRESSGTSTMKQSQEILTNQIPVFGGNQLYLSSGLLFPSVTD